MLSTATSLSGLVITVAGLRFDTTSRARRWLFLIGAVLLLVSSVAAAHTFFIALEVVVTLGCVLAFVAGHRTWKGAAMLTAGAAVLLWLAPDSSGLEIVGGIGLIGVAAGFATNAPAFYAAGSLVVSVRALIEFVSEPSLLPAVFGVLNLTFVVVCAVQMRAAQRRGR